MNKIKASALDLATQIDKELDSVKNVYVEKIQKLSASEISELSSNITAENLGTSIGWSLLKEAIAKTGEKLPYNPKPNHPEVSQPTIMEPNLSRTKKVKKYPRTDVK